MSGMKISYGEERIYNKNFNNLSPNIILWEVLKIEKFQKIMIRFISQKSIYRQGIRIAIDVGDGFLSTNGVEAKSVNLWMDETPQNIIIECYLDRGLLSIYNIFEKLDGWGKGKYSQTAYSGMIIERKDNIYRYKCNDTGLQTDFDKLVFEIELL